MATQPPKPAATKTSRKPVINTEERRKYWFMAFLIVFATINPLFLYRIPGVGEHLYLHQWFGFASLWQQNDIGLSLAELLVWILAFLPFYETVPFTNIEFDIIPKIIVGLIVGGGLVWIGIEIRRKFWIAFNNFNDGWALKIALKKVAMFGVPIAVIMLSLNYWGGVPFSIWNIVEVSLWICLAILAAVVAVGMLWIFDLRYDAGTMGVNVTTADETPSDSHSGEHDH